MKGGGVVDERGWGGGLKGEGWWNKGGGVVD